MLFLTRFSDIMEDLPICYLGGLELPYRPELLAGMLNFVEERGYDYSLEPDGEFGFKLRTNKPLSEHDEKVTRGFPHTISFTLIE